MSNAIRRVAPANGRYDYVVAIDPANYPVIDWVIDPDISGVSNVPQMYWKWDSSTSTVIEMTESEKDAVDDYGELDDVVPVQVVTIYIEEEFAIDETKVIDLNQYGQSNLKLHAAFDPSVTILAKSSLLSADGSGPVGWDAGNVSTNEKSINNGSYTDLVYNNSVSGNTSGVILGIDMITPTKINYMKRWDYSSTYYDKVWEFIGTDDPTGKDYTVIFTQSQKGPYLDPTPFEKGFPEVVFRYYGWRCVTSNNSSYTISREMELYYGENEVVQKALKLDDDYEFYIDKKNQLHVTNKNVNRTLRIVLMGNEE